MYVYVIEYICKWDTIDSSPHKRVFQGSYYDDVVKQIDEFVKDKSRGILEYEIVSVYGGDE